MTAAIAGAARAAGTKSAAGATASAAGKSAGSAAGARTATKATPRKAPVDRGLTDAQKAGGVKQTPPAPDSAPQQRQTPEQRLNSMTVNLPAPVGSGAGFILALLAWTWIGVPLLQRGPQGVKDQLRAKFLNKGPDGKWLP